MCTAAWRLFLLSFAALFLETAFIRWSPSQINILAFFANLILISSFLGLGIGTGGFLGRSRLHPLLGLPVLLAAVWGLGIANQLAHGSVWLPMALIGAGILGAIAAALRGRLSPVRLAAALAGLVLIGTIATWAARRFTAYYFIWGIKDWRTVLLAIVAFAANAFFFAELGRGIGDAFARVAARRAYAVNLAGSLVGVLVQWGFSAFGVPPVAWFALAFAVLWVSLPAAGMLGRGAATILLAWVVWATWPDPESERWSPYYRIRLQETQGILMLNVNTDMMTGLPLVPTPALPDGVSRAERAAVRPPRHVPYLFGPPGRVLILGSGGAVDVTAALQEGASRVDAVEIDPTIQEIAETRNADHPFADPRVRVHLTDARAWVRSAQGPYTHVVYGFLDSQRILGWLSNIRLDNYVYTVEGIRDSLRLLDPERGVLGLYFSVNREWIGRKLYGLLRVASGRKPMVLETGSSRVFLVGPGVDPADVAPPFRDVTAEYLDSSGVDIPTDDWPQLYYKNRTLSGAYVAALGVILAGTAWTLRRSIGGTGTALFFFQGAGFLLVETWALTRCGLLFGATWLVNPIVLSAALAVSLAAVGMSRRVTPFLLWAGLFAGLAACLLVPKEPLLEMPMLARGLAAGTLIGLPIFFSGGLFTLALERSANPRGAFGANLLGAVFGGVIEFVTLVTGNRVVLLLAAVLYLAALGCWRKRPATGSGP